MRKLEGLNSPILDLEGNPLANPDGSKVTVGRLIANVIARGASEEPVRAMDIALKIYNADGELEIEDADYVLVKKTVEDDKILNNMAKAAILNILI